jgi:serine/threonine protein kinase
MGVIHRDIKPANVMLEAAVAGATGGKELGRPLLMDFGLALREAAEVTLTLDGHVLGTPAQGAGCRGEIAAGDDAGVVRPSARDSPTDCPVGHRP